MKLQNRLLLAVLCASSIFTACNKMQEKTDQTPTTQQTTNSTDLVPTPGGMLPRSNVHLIENGYKLIKQNNHFMKVDTRSGSIVQDFGEITPAPAKRPGTQSSGPRTSGSAPGAELTSWVTYAEWDNTSTTPISSFVTTWAVPNQPTTTTDGQLIYIFNALQDADSTEIIQPVLQWGVGPDGGGTYWSIANWYVSGYSAFFSDIITNLSPGTSLQGILTLNGQNMDGTYSYTSSFSGYSNPLTISEGDESNGSTMPSLPFQALADETLEAYGPGGYGVVQASDYPAGQNYINMNQIAIYENGVFTDAIWNAFTGNTEFGESTMIWSQDGFVPGKGNVEGDVFLYYHPIPRINGLTNVEMNAPNTPYSYSIEGYPGGAVTITVTAGGNSGHVPFHSISVTGTVTISTPGVTFTNGSTSVSATSASAAATFIMPASGSITVSGGLTTPYNGGVESVLIQVY